MVCYYTLLCLKTDLRSHSTRMFNPCTVNIISIVTDTFASPLQCVRGKRTNGQSLMAGHTHTQTEPCNFITDAWQMFSLRVKAEKSIFYKHSTYFFDNLNAKNALKRTADILHGFHHLFASVISSYPPLPVNGHEDRHSTQHREKQHQRYPWNTSLFQ